MAFSRHLPAAAVCWLAFGMFVTAQEGPLPGARPGGRRGNTRDFLGLGAEPDAAAAGRGEKLYAPNCAFCHGAKANGAEGPDLVRSTVVLHDEKGELVGPVIKNGRPEKGMPAFANFSAEQLYDLSQFLHMRVELAANRGLYKPINIVTGDPKAGEAYFDAKCKSCHSPSGDLAHIGSKLEATDLQQSFLYPGARGYMPGTPKITKVTVTTRSGQTFSGSLKRLDDFNVSLFDSKGEYHSFPIEPGVKIEIEDKLTAHRELLKQYTDHDMHNLTAYLASLK